MFLCCRHAARRARLALLLYDVTCFSAVGTLLSAPGSLCCSTRHTSHCKAFFYMLLAAFLQMLTCLLIVGWIWSIRWDISRA